MSSAIVTAIFDEIAAALARGDRVELRGFGAFSVKRRDARHRAQPAHRRQRAGRPRSTSPSSRPASSCATGSTSPRAPTERDINRTHQLGQVAERSAMKLLFWIVVALVASGAGALCRVQSRERDARSCGRCPSLSVCRFTSPSWRPADRLHRRHRRPPGSPAGAGGAKFAGAAAASARSNASWPRPRRSLRPRGSVPRRGLRRAAEALRAHANHRRRRDPPIARFPEPDRRAARDVPRRLRGAGATSSQRRGGDGGGCVRHLAGDAGLAGRARARRQDRHGLSRQRRRARCPRCTGTYLLLDAATGMPLALLDGTALTLAAHRGRLGARRRISSPGRIARCI